MKMYQKTPLLVSPTLLPSNTVTSCMYWCLCFAGLYHRLPLDNPVCQQDVDVVVTLACGKWRQFGRALGFSLSRTEDIVSCHSQIRDSEKLQMIISEWKAESGEKATIGKLLKACDHEAVQVMRSVVVELAKLNQVRSRPLSQSFLTHVKEQSRLRF